MKEVVTDFKTLVASLQSGKPPQVEQRVEQNLSLLEPIRDNTYWSLFADNQKLAPLKFSNGKTQEDVVRETVDLIQKGTKVVLIHGVCGTGKSAIALNIARMLGRASIVVPVKSLQQQYEQDYMGKKYLLKRNGSRLNIAMITGRENHDSLIKPGASCADPFLPETVKITDKNMDMIKQFYKNNPLINERSEQPMIKDLKRISIAPTNPYWSPILPAHFEAPLDDARKRKYRGLGGNDFIFYQRREGCTYYDQYNAYIDADVIIFNAAKYKIESALNRKPATDVEIIDEADEFLDNFSTQHTLNLTRLANSLSMMHPEEPSTREAIRKILDFINLEERNKHALGIAENEIYTLKETKVKAILELLIDNSEIEDEVHLDEFNYITHVLQIARTFEDFLDDTYCTFKREEKDLHTTLVTTNLSEQFREMVEKNKALVLMSGTLHSDRVMKEVFGIKDYAVVQAETKAPGVIEIVRTGKEFDCKFANFSSGAKTRVDYLQALAASLQKAKKPTLVHVNAFEDLPSMQEQYENGLLEVMSREQIKEQQINDKNNQLVSQFKAKRTDRLFTTKCARGVDFPGDVCNSVVFTKYPNPNPKDIFWKVLQKTHAPYFWEFYKDKARREVLQRVYRALRSKNDHVYVLSPDSRVLDAMRELQKQMS